MYFFQNERLLIYLMAFVFGSFCYKRKVFDRKPKGKALYITINAVAWIPINIYIMFLLYPWINPGQYIISQFVHRIILWSNFHLSLVSLVYLMVETFRRYFDRQGKICSGLRKNSYYVYIIHTIVLGILALVLLNTEMHSVLKYFILTVSTFAVSNIVVTAFRMSAAYLRFKSASNKYDLKGNLCKA